MVWLVLSRMLFLVSGFCVSTVVEARTLSPAVMPGQILGDTRNHRGAHSVPEPVPELEPEPEPVKPVKPVWPVWPVNVNVTVGVRSSALGAYKTSTGPGLQAAQPPIRGPRAGLVPPPRCVIGLHSPVFPSSDIHYPIIPVFSAPWAPDETHFSNEALLKGKKHNDLDYLLLLFSSHVSFIWASRRLRAGRSCFPKSGSFLLRTRLSKRSPFFVNSRRGLHNSCGAQI